MSVRSTHVCVQFYKMHLLEGNKIVFCRLWQLMSLPEPHMTAGAEEGPGFGALLRRRRLSCIWYCSYLIFVSYSSAPAASSSVISCHILVRCYWDTIRTAPGLLDAVWRHVSLGPESWQLGELIFRAMGYVAGASAECQPLTDSVLIIYLLLFETVMCEGTEQRLLSLRAKDSSCENLSCNKYRIVFVIKHLPCATHYVECFGAFLNLISPVSLWGSWGGTPFYTRGYSGSDQKGSRARAQRN